MHRDAVVLKFLNAIDTDLASGALHDVETYVQRFPTHADLIRSEYRRLRATPPSALEEHPARRIGKRYRVLESLGRGGFGEVFLAEDEHLQRRVAIKVLAGLRAINEEWRTRLVREAQAMNRISDPGLCPVYDVGFDDGSPFLVMPWIPGRSLERLIAASATRGEGPVQLDAEESPRERRDAFLLLVERVARTLHAAHEAGVVHRDVKPANILVRPDGHPIVIDFGLAWLESNATLTRSGALGTTAYASPEVLREEAFEPDARLDVWSLGVVLYEGLTLRRPFTARPGTSLERDVLESPLPRLDHSFPRDLQAIVETALARRRDDRYPTAAAFADDLARVRQGEPVAARAAGPLRRIGWWMRSRPRAIGLAIALLAIGGSSIFFAVLHVSRQRELAVVGRTVTILAEGIDRLVVDAEEAARFGLSLEGRAVEAERLLATVRSLRAEVAPSIDIDRSLGRVLLACAALHIRREMLDTGNERAEEGRRIFESVVATGESTPEDHAALALAHVLIGDVANHRGNHAEAIARFRSALGIDERLLAIEPDRPTRISDVGFGYLRLGRLLVLSGHIDEGIDHIARAVAFLQDAERLDRDSIARREHTCDAVLELITSLVWLEDSAPRRRELIHDLEADLRRSTQRFPRSYNLWLRLHGVLSRKRELVTTPEERLTVDEETIWAAQRLVELEPTSPEAHLRLGTAFLTRADSLTELEQDTASLDAAQQGLEKMKQAYESSPNVWMTRDGYVNALLEVLTRLAPQGEPAHIDALRSEASRVAEERWRTSDGDPRALKTLAQVLSSDAMGNLADPDRVLQLVGTLRAEGKTIGRELEALEGKCRGMVEERAR